MKKLDETIADYPRDQSLHALISKQVGRTPSNVVFESGDQTLSYEQLEEQSNRLAQYLIGQGVTAGSLIGVCCERDLNTAVSLLGILKAGAGYVPLDPDYPTDRLQYMVQDSGLSTIVSNQSLAPLVNTFDKPVVFVDRDADAEAIARQPAQNPNVEIDPKSHIAYVIYTSGSTGRPKGVLVPHQTVVNFLWGMKEKPGFTADDVMLGVTTLSFDISVPEMFLPMIVGGRTAIVDRRTAKDGQLLIEAVQRHQVTVMQATPSTWRFFLEAGFDGGLPNFRAFTAGEQFPRDLSQPLLDRCDELWNLYGPTETTVYSTRFKITNADERILIGEPWENTSLYVVDDQDQVVATGEEGELLIGGEGVTGGYLNRDDLNAEKFVELRGERVYRTGDLARFTENGLLECLGRIDSQVKLHGHRIELEEIDAVLASQPSVRRAATLVREDVPGDQRLVAYLIANEPTRVDGEPSALDIAGLRQHLVETLPDYMVPATFVELDSFPQTPSGKLDRKALPKPDTKRPNLGVDYIAPNTEIEKQVADIWAGVLQLDRVGIEDNFFDLGGNSILALKAIARMKVQLQIRLNAPELFDNPTVRQLLAYVQKKSQARNLLADRSQAVPTDDDVAIVGMAARFPGAKNVGQFWENLCNGVESISFFAPDELDSSLDPQVAGDPNYVAARGIVEDAEKFDANFFGITPRESELIDPQQRVMLELAWTALEDAGCVPDRYEGSIGVWTGTYTNTYFVRNILTRPELMSQTGEFQMGVYNEKDYIATRLAHKLNLTGPAINVNTACSTSLVAVIEACNSLARRHCDVALAGGASVTFPQKSGHVHQTGSIMSPDGHCRPFDKDAAGTLFSDGAGVVVLKRLEDAIRDGDRIYAVVKGLGINNDGGEKASFTAPSIQGQANAVAMAHSHAAVPIETIEYVETHGTATPIGDPIEVQALATVFAEQTEQRQFCGIGSVKSNMGHTVAAAGIAGLMKSALALHYEKIPATLNFQAPNPQIDFESSPFFVCDKLREWPRKDSPRRAGVSSFGVGGTNAHIVIEEAPVPTKTNFTCTAYEPQANGPPVQLLPVSTKNESALEEAMEGLQVFATSLPAGFDLADLAYTLQVGRSEFRQRAFCVAADVADAATGFEKMRPPRFGRGKAGTNDREVVFMFPGQGSQYVWMGKNLYDHSPVFRRSLDECCEILKPLLGRDLRDVLFPLDGDEEAAAEILRSTDFTQPALFAIGYSLAQQWKSYGVEPKCLIGHSIGEFVAACLSGVFSLEDGLKLIAKRGQLMRALPGGSMLSVRAPADQVEPLLSGQLAIASYNGPTLCVIAGPDKQVADIQKRLEGDEIACRLLHTSHAFHSPMMDEIVEPFTKFVSEISLSKPTQPIMSTVTGEWMTDADATDPNYWAGHLRKPVKFSQAIDRLWNENEDRILIEVGPRTTLATLARQHATDRKAQLAIASLADSAENNAEWFALLAAVGQLWISGAQIDWNALQHGKRHQIVSAPTYPFQRKRYFLEPNPASANSTVTSTVASAPSVATSAITAPVVLNDTSLISNQNLSSTPAKEIRVTSSRLDQIHAAINNILEETSGIDASDFDASTTFFEMGMDSLVLTQTAAAIKKEFGINVTFRQMLEQTPTVAALVELLDEELPADRFVDIVEEQVVVNHPTETAGPATETPLVAQGNDPTAFPPLNEFAQTSMGQQMGFASQLAVGSHPHNGSETQTIIQTQLQLMQQQLQVLAGASVLGAHPQQASASIATQQVNQVGPGVANGIAPSPSSINVPGDSNPEAKDLNAPKKKAFGAAARVNLENDALSAERQAALDTFIQQYIDKTPSSKAYAQQHRRYLADPRTVSGFSPTLKEMTYPLVVNRSKGVHLWDIDGNRFLDLTCGFGSNFLGHTPDFMVAQIRDQLEQGYEIGPQHPLAGEVAKLFTEMTGMERVAFCNTGSEAVLCATRLARTATARDKIVMFNGDYHGILDEVVVRGGKNHKCFPAATGIPKSAVENVVILEYGEDESLKYIEEHLDELAAVVVEPVQSRRPELQPKQFLQSLAAITRDAETALIFDEVITGLRIGFGGAQEHFGVEADIATYGKVVGGGMPIGVIAGKAKYLDGLDGGFWEFGNDSKPEAGMTYFAGTFVRHPLALAAAKGILTHLREQGPGIYDRINGLANHMAKELNDVFTERQVPFFLANFGSLFKVQFREETPYSELLFAALRRRGFHIWDHRPCLLTLAHTEEHVSEFVQAFRESIIELQESGFLPDPACTSLARTALSPGSKTTADADLASPPSDDAKLGKDKSGNPAWFVPDAENPGQFIQISTPTV